MGLIPSQTSGLRPWTRAECRRQLLEADEAPVTYGADIRSVLRTLHREFDTPGPKDSSVVLQSVYVRGGAIAGPLLNDSLHFGQTWTNDLGRPFGRGWIGDAGFTATAEAGRFFGSVQAEYQHAPSAAPYSLEVRQTIAQLDGIPLQGADSQSALNRFRSVELYGGIRLANVEVSVGKQALWWGPGLDSPFSFGSNAEPTKNLKVSTVHPIRLPVLFGIRSGFRAEFLIGKLGGQKYAWRPWFNAQKISFKLTENLEMGFTRWSIFWGVGHPITVGSFVRNFTSFTSPEGLAGVGRNDPGDRKGGFDFRYRVPGLRNWITLYSDSYSEDDPSPLAAPRRAAINPGLYLSRIPALPRLDLHLEAPSTTPLGASDPGGQSVYFNNQYRGGNTNYGNLLGNPVGRDGRSLQARATYWFSARNRLELSSRQTKTSARFLAGGATQTRRRAEELPRTGAWMVHDSNFSI